MNKYQVDRVALHLVSKDGAQLAKEEILLGDFSLEDQKSIQEFFAAHLKHIWNAGEARTTCSAQFQATSEIQKYYENLRLDQAKFFSYSGEMAKLLQKAAQKTRASAGVLMVLWLRTDGDDRSFLALLKLEPARADKIALSQSNGKLLLKLAVRHIDQALPEPGDQVLKWAITPHPNRSAYQVKVRDEEGKELAQYFMKFLGCDARLSERKQIERILQIIPDYTREHHRKVDLSTVVPTVLADLEQVATITPDVVIDKIKENKAFKNFSEDNFRKELEQAKISDMSVSADALRATKLQYKLPSGIIIKGPRAVMESQIKMVSVGNEVEFRIRSTKQYEKTYVG